MSKRKRYTWEEKIDNLVTIAKVMGTYLEVEIEDPGTDGHRETRRKAMEAYEEFCQWRHDEPYVVDEIRALLAQKE